MPNRLRGWWERRQDPLLPRTAFYMRLVKLGGAAVLVALFALIVGVVGYHHFAGLPWVDSLLNASMILGGMGPVDPLKSTSAKLFASGYALFSGLVFLAVVGILAAPFIHRLLHHFHLEGGQEGQDEPR